MTPEQQLEANMRQMAMQLADKRISASANIDKLLEEAERVLKFLRAGMTVAA